MDGMPDFVSLNGPDNAGKTTHLRQLAACWGSFQFLGSVHEHDPEPWSRAARDGYARWWFETSSTGELSRMLFASHLKRVPRGSPGESACWTAVCPCWSQSQLPPAC